MSTNLGWKRVGVAEHHGSTKSRTANKQLAVSYTKDCDPNLAPLVPCHPTRTCTTMELLSQKREESNAHVTSVGERKVMSL